MNCHATIATQSLTAIRPAMLTKPSLMEISRPAGNTAVLTAVQRFTELMTDLCTPGVFMVDLHRMSRLIYRR